MLLVPILLLIACAATFAQVDRAVLEGTVTDPTGAVIRGAGVQVLAVDTGLSQEQQTNSNGYYRFPGLAVGRYTVTVTNSKFTTKVVDDVILQVGQTRTLNIKLEVGGWLRKLRSKRRPNLRTAVPPKPPR